jgi:hypothetical protein
MAQLNTHNMNKKVFDAMYSFLDANHGFTKYKIDGYYGFAYLTIEWADGPAKYKFSYISDDEIERKIVT